MVGPGGQFWQFGSLTVDGSATLSMMRLDCMKLKSTPAVKRGKRLPNGWPQALNEDNNVDDAVPQANTLYSLHLVLDP